MRRFSLILMIITLVMMLCAFAVKWFGMSFFAPLSLMVLPLAVLYFAVVDYLQYWFLVRSMNKSPKRFVQLFLGATVAVLFLHMVVLVFGMLNNPAAGKRFAVAFLILYVVYTVYVIAALVRYVREAQRRQ